MYILLLIFIAFLVYLVDQLLTNFYCRLQVKKDQKYGLMTYQKPHEAGEKSSAFPYNLFRWMRVLYSGWIRYKLIRLGHIPCHAYRNFILRHVYKMKIAKTAVLYGGFEIRSPWKIEIGEGSIIGDEAKLDGRNGIIIGKNVNFSTGVWIWTEQHDLNDPYFASNQEGGTVVIADRAWISSRTTLLPGIQVGEGCVLAAGATAVKNLEPAFTVWGGVPAKCIGERKAELRYEFSGDHEAFW